MKIADEFELYSAGKLEIGRRHRMLMQKQVYIRLLRSTTLIVSKVESSSNSILVVLRSRISRSQAL